MWSHFVPKIWELIATLNPKVLVGALQGMVSIVRGSASIPVPEVSPDAFLANLIDLGDKLMKEFSKDEESGNQFA
jgi:hypothetical protein